MKWKDFIKPIQQSGISPGAKEKAMRELFGAAGSSTDFSDSAAKSWLKGDRNCKVSAYFPDGKVNTKAVFSYFRRRPDSNLYQLQQTFREQISPDSDSPIDTKTRDLDIFCWSLVNQFLDILSLQRIDIPVPDNFTPDDSVKVAIQPDRQTTEQPNENLASSGPAVSTTVPGDLMPHGDPNFKQEHPPITSMFLPHSERCCFYCSHWQGKTDTLYAYFNSAYATCLKYNRENQLSSATPCQNYKANQRLLNLMKLGGYNTDHLI